MISNAVHSAHQLFRLAVIPEPSGEPLMHAILLASRSFNMEGNMGLQSGRPQARVGVSGCYTHSHGSPVYLSIGVFAGPKKIPGMSFIGVYAGEYLTDDEGEKRGL